MRLRTLASIAAALLLPVLLSSPASAYDMGAPDTPVRLSAGLSHTAFVDQEGVLWTWGSNQSGQLGAETQETGTDLEGTVIPLSSRPLQVMEDVASVSAGADFTVALKTDGTLWAWGGNDYGQLGNGSTTPSDLPICVLDQVTAVSAGDYHVAALRADGSLWTWGDNLYGQLGDGTLESRSAPAKVLDQAAAVSAGAGSTAALLGDQTLWTWGDNLFGQLGDGTRASRSTPAKVLDQVTAVSMGGDHAAALRADGTLWLWGSNIDGQLGNGGQGNTTDQTGAQLQTLPLSLSTTGPVTAVSAGTSHTAVILADGSLWTWGRNDTQQLGLDQTAPTVSLPAQVPAVTQAAAVGTGTYQTVCLLSDDTLFSWGPQAMGLLGGGAVETLAEVPKAEAAAPAEATQVTFQEETAAWVPLAILAGSAILLVLAGCLSRKERVGV